MKKDKNMKRQIRLGPSYYFLHFNSGNGILPALLIVSNSAGYFAESPKYGIAGPRVDKFCTDLSLKFDVYYLVLQGQDKEYQDNYWNDTTYSYSRNIDVVDEAIRYLRSRTKIVGVIGMCTGAAIAIEAMEETGDTQLPMVLYNTAARVGWNDPAIQKIFLRKYGKWVNLDCDELQRNAPAELVPIIQKHQGKMLQIISGKSDYKQELQEEVAQKIPTINSKTFLTMSDAPIGESDEYQLMVQTILDFFK